MNITITQDPEIAFFREIEREFVVRRGNPMFISNADWVFLAKLWKKGIPKRVVLRGITDAFDAHALSFARKQKIRSLSFCEDDINAAVDRYRRALLVDGPSRRGLSAAIERFDESLASLTVSPEMMNALAEARRGLNAIVEEVQNDKAKTFDAEKAFAAVEDALVAAASSALGSAAIADIEKETRSATASCESRMPTTVYETLIGESVRRKILQHFGLPRILLAEIE